MDPRQVSDELEIAALLNTYARAVDTKDWELYRSVFTDDAHIDYSAAVFTGSLDEAIEFFAGDFSALVTMSMHYITNIESEIDGDTARVRAMFYNPTQIRESRTCACSAATTTTIWFAHQAAGEAGTSARKWCGPPTPRATVRPEPPIAHRRRRFRGHACHAPCTKRHARAPA